MNTSTWFDDLPVIGQMSPTEALTKLREIDENTDSDILQDLSSYSSGGVLGASDALAEADWWRFLDRPWKHTSHTFGYLGSAESAGWSHPVQHINSIIPNTNLKNARIKITLDRMRVASYPGGGTHLVLSDFYARNQLQDHTEDLHFTTTCNVRQGEHAAILGYPIFVGLNVGDEGILFRCYTVNVKNSADEAFLGFLESDIFRSGLKLITTIQPAIAPLSSMAYNLTKAIAKRHRNVGVQKFEIGLDFSTIPTRARLAEGAYIAVQIPENRQLVWDWNQWEYQPTSGQVLNKTNSQLIPYNYLIFSISRYEG